jgi:hypothetical protein
VHHGFTSDARKGRVASGSAQTIGGSEVNLVYSDYDVVLCGPRRESEHPPSVI